MNRNHQKMIESFQKRYAHGLDSWSRCGYLKEGIQIFFNKYSNVKIKDVFEVGIGSAISSEQILERGCKLTGIDIATNSNWNSLKEKWGNCFFATEADIVYYKSIDTFDLVIDNGCFHHQDPALYKIVLNNINALLKNDGIFFLSVFKESDVLLSKGHVELIDGGNRICKFFTEDEIDNVLDENNFQVIEKMFVARSFKNAEVMICVCKKARV